MKKNETVYFDKGGPANTQATLEAARVRAADAQPAALVVASTSGKTALVAAKTFAGTGIRIIAVPFQKHLWDEYGAPDPKIVAECRAMGVEFLPEEPPVAMLDSGHPEIVNAWRTVSEGFKVALQVSSMCVDAGLLKPGSRVIGVGGSGTGADTAIVLKTYGSRAVLKSRVQEIIAMPAGR